MNLHQYEEKFIEVMKSIQKIKKNKIIFFGAGNMPKFLLDVFPLEVSYYIDNNKQKQGAYFNGSIIRNPNSLLEEDKDKICIFITSVYYDEISKQLKKMEFLEGIHFINANFLYECIIYSKEQGLLYLLREYIRKLFYCDEIDFGQFKKILMVKKEHWASLSYTIMSLTALSNGYEIIFIDDSNKNKEFYDFNVDNNFKKINYKGINLYSVSIHNICIELDNVIQEIDINNWLHKEAISKWYNIAVDYIDKANLFFERYDFNKAIIFQGHMYDCAIIRQLAIQKNVEVFSFEFTFNKNKVIWDNISGLSVNKNLAKNFYWRHKDMVNLELAREYTKRYIEDIKEYKLTYHSTPTNILEKEKRKKTIIYIGQIYTDSSIVFGIRSFKNPIEIIKCLADYCIENQYELIIKLHPSETKLHGGDKYNQLTFTKIKQDEILIDQIEKHTNIIIDNKNEYDTYNLIDRADVCVTINSQAGLEALAKGKDVILCGNSSYDGLGFTYEAQNQDMLKYFLDMVLKKNISLVDKDEIYKFFYIFNEYYCIDKIETSIIHKVIDYDIERYKDKQ